MNSDSLVDTKSSNDYNNLMEIFLLFMSFGFASRLVSSLVTKLKGLSDDGETHENLVQRRQRASENVERFLKTVVLNDLETFDPDQKLSPDNFRTFASGLDAPVPLDYNECFKISIVGYYNVGKTSLAQFLFGLDDLKSKDDVKGRLVVNGKQCELTISHCTDSCDVTTGSFNISSEFIENTADAYVIVYAMEDQNDLEIVRHYLRLAKSREKTTTSTPVFLVCNKRDLWTERDPRWEKFMAIRELARREAIPFVATSTRMKDTNNVDVLFYHLIKLLRLFKANEITNDSFDSQVKPLDFVF